MWRKESGRRFRLLVVLLGLYGDRSRYWQGRSSLSRVLYLRSLKRGGRLFDLDTDHALRRPTCFFSLPTVDRRKPGFMRLQKSYDVGERVLFEILTRLFTSLFSLTDGRDKRYGAFAYFCVLRRYPSLPPSAETPGDGGSRETIPRLIEPGQLPYVDSCVHLNRTRRMGCLDSPSALLLGRKRVPFRFPAMMLRGSFGLHWKCMVDPCSIFLGNGWRQ